MFPHTFQTGPKPFSETRPTTTFQMWWLSSAIPLFFLAHHHPPFLRTTLFLYWTVIYTINLSELIRNHHIWQYNKTQTNITSEQRWQANIRDTNRDTNRETWTVLCHSFDHHVLFAPFDHLPDTVSLCCHGYHFFTLIPQDEINHQ